MASPNLEQTFRNMIEAARNGAEFYGHLAGRTGDSEANAFLAGLAARERAHAQAIEVLALESTDRALPRFADRYVDHESTTSAWRFVEGITYSQAIDVALDAASHAALLYGALADSAAEPMRSLLSGLAEQQEAHVEQLVALRKRPRAGVWNYRDVSRSDVKTGIRNGIEAERAAARVHAGLSVRSADRAARVFLGQVALEEEAHAEELVVLAREQTHWTLPRRAEPHAKTIKLPAFIQLPDTITLAFALEHALHTQTRGARYYRILASLDSEAAPALDAFARAQEDHLTRLIDRRNTYWFTRADDMPSLVDMQIDRLLKDKS